MIFQYCLHTCPDDDCSEGPMDQDILHLINISNGAVTDKMKYWFDDAVDESPKTSFTHRTLRFDEMCLGACPLFADC